MGTLGSRALGAWETGREAAGGAEIGTRRSVKEEREGREEDPPTPVAPLAKGLGHKRTQNVFCCERKIKCIGGVMEPNIRKRPVQARVGVKR